MHFNHIPLCHCHLCSLRTSLLCVFLLFVCNLHNCCALQTIIRKYISISTYKMQVSCSKQLASLRCIHSRASRTLLPLSLPTPFSPSFLTPDHSSYQMEQLLFCGLLVLFCFTSHMTESMHCCVSESGIFCKGEDLHNHNILLFGFDYQFVS